MKSRNLAICVALLLGCSAVLQAQDSFVQDAPLADAVVVDDGHAACSACCNDCCCGSSYTFWANALLMTRESPDNQVLLVDSDFDPVFNASQFDFDYELGFEVGAHKQLDCCNGIAVRFMMQDNWEANARTFEGILPDPDTDFAPTFTDLRYTSEFLSAEVNWTRNACGVNVFAGFRYVEIDENLLGTWTYQTTPPPTNWTDYTAEFDTDNRLYGFQVGADTELCNNCGPLSVRGLVNAGVYYNDASADFNYTANSLHRSSNGSHTSFLGELGLQAVYRVSCNLSVVAGYQAMFVSGVATASDQLSGFPKYDGYNHRNLNSKHKTQTDNDIFYHGGTFGLIGTY